MEKVEELKDLGCSVRGRFYDLAWSKPVLRATAVHGVSSLCALFFKRRAQFHKKMLIKEIAITRRVIYLDYKLDESYTPARTGFLKKEHQ